MSDLKQYRLRARFARKGEAARLSQLEQIRLLRAAVSSCGLPCAMSGGKKRLPRMAFGPAISVGYESEAEYADICLCAPVPEREAFAKLSAACGGGFSALGVKRIPLHFPSLESLLNVAEYEVSGDFGPEPDASLERFLARPEIPVVKQKHEGPQERIDARPLIMEMKHDSGRLRLMLRFSPGRNLKPELILRAWLDREISGFAVTRKQLYWETPGGLSAP
ncbi:MAG: TIGR03936 family radical SAM-associated protein [Elusimicrobiales bacterium]